MSMSDLERIRQAKKKAIDRIFSQQTEIGCWISERITDPKSANVDATAFMLEYLIEHPENISRTHEYHAVTRAVTIEFKS